MTISEAMRKTSDEYDAEVDMARKLEPFGQAMKETLGAEDDEIDKELPSYVAEIAQSMGVKVGTFLPPYVYQIARMCFRMGMRVQRKIDRPDRETTAFWKQSA